MCIFFLLSLSISINIDLVQPYLSIFTDFFLSVKKTIHISTVFPMYMQKKQTINRHFSIQQIVERAYLMTTFLREEVHYCLAQEVPLQCISQIKCTERCFLCHPCWYAHLNCKILSNVLYSILHNVQQRMSESIQKKLMSLLSNLLCNKLQISVSKSHLCIFSVTSAAQNPFQECVGIVRIVQRTTPLIFAPTVLTGELSDNRYTYIKI